MSETTVCESLLHRDVINQSGTAEPAEKDSESFAQRMLQERRANNPIVSVEKMRIELEKEVVLYALDCLKEEGVIGNALYESAVKIALKC